jgi:hypothetical protein
VLRGGVHVHELPHGLSTSMHFLPNLPNLMSFLGSCGMKARVCGGVHGLCGGL